MTVPGRRLDPGRTLEAVGLAAVLGLAAWVRLARFARPLAAGELLAVDGDSHFHVRRIHAALRGELSVLDPLVNWPHGGVIPWADGFDWMGAAFAILAGGGCAGPRTENAIFLWAPVLGVLVVWATVAFTRRLVPPGDRATPLAAGLAAALVPHLVEVSTVGNVDHHVAEALSLLLLLSWSLRRFPADGEDAPGPGWEVAGSLASALALWVFIGGEFYVALAAAPLFLAALRGDPSRRMVGSGAPALLAGAAFGLGVALPAIAVHGRLLSFTVPSLLQPGLVAVAGLALGAIVVAGQFPRGHERRGVELAIKVAAGLGTVLLVLAVIPPLRREIAGGLRGWMMREDPWIARIGEFQPLLTRTPEYGWDMRHARYLLGPLGMLGTLALPLGVATAWTSSPARAAAFGLAATAVTLLALLQLRFTRVAAPLLAIALALAMKGIASVLTRFGLPGWLRAPLPLLAVALLAAASPSARMLVAPAPPRAPSPVHQVALALRLDRPPEHGRRDGVLAPWDQGHALLQVSGRPVVANGFGTYLDPEGFEEVEASYRGDEARLVATMERRDLGFVIGGGHALAGHQAVPGRGSMVEGDPPVLNLRWMKATPLSQLLIAGSGLPSVEVPHLERLMPVAASEAVAGGLSFPLPVVWAFELVPGARITGRAGPGELVTGEIALREWGRPHRYRAWTRADGEGRFTLRVAVPARFGSQAIETGPSWRITAGDRPPVEVEVPEQAVRGGLEVRLP